MNPSADGFSLLRSLRRRRPRPDDSETAAPLGDRHLANVTVEPATQRPTADQLLGEHAALVDELTTLLRSDDPTDRVVLVRAASGQGKSRVVREVYDQLARDDSYWPGLDDIDRGAPDARRKQLGPEPRTFTWAKGALPTFAWWHVNCEDLAHGSAADIAAQLEMQLKAHAVPLELAPRAGDERVRLWLEKFGDTAVGWVKDLAEDTVEDKVDAALSQVIHLPGLGPAIGLGYVGAKGLYGLVRKLRALRREEDTGLEVRATREQHLRDLARLVRGLSSPSIPAVVVVEDLHAMSRDMTTFLSELLTESDDKHHRVVVIATEWPEASGEQHQYWVRSLETYDVKRLVPLTPDELAQLVKAAAPETPADVAVAVARSFDNPLALQRWLRLATVVRTIEAHGGALTTDTAADLHSHMAEQVDAVQQERWSELSAPVQKALMYAVAAQGATDGPVGYVPEVVTRVVEALDDGTDDELLPAFASAVDPAAWARQHDDLHVTEPVATRCIWRAASRDLRLSPSELRRLPERAVSPSERYLRDRVEAARVGEAVRSPALSHIASQLLERHVDTAGPEARFVATYVRAVHNVHSRDLAAALDGLLGEVDLGAPTVGARTRASAAVLAARCVVAVAADDEQRLSQVSRLLAAALDATAAQPSALDADETSTLRAHADEVEQLLVAKHGGDVSAFLARRTDAALAAAPQRGPQQTVAELVQVALLAYDTQGRKQAASRIREALDLAQAQLGKDASLTMDVAVLYLALVGHDAPAREHVALVSEMVDVARAVYGEEDHRTLDLLRQQLRWELKACPSEELALRFDSFVEATVRLVGRMHPMSIRARIEQAQAWSRCPDRGDHGIKLIGALLDETTRALGATHPTTSKVAWYRTYQVVPYARNRAVDTSTFSRATPDGDSRSARRTWTEEESAALREHYGVRLD